MNIFDTKFEWNGTLQGRRATDMIILHHSVMDGDVMDIHKLHIKKGWSGIGYHFYIRRDGSIFRGRPIEKAGAHTIGYNSNSIGICFEGNFDIDKMKEDQLEAGRKLIAHINDCYEKKIKVYKHSDFAETACPGRKFPYDKIIRVSSDDTVTKMYEDGIITFKNVENWELFLSGKARAKSSYIRAVINRYQQKIS